MKKGIVLGIALLSIPFFASAQTERSYHYADISYTYDVHTDTTVSVEERQTYAFVGYYHQADRTIPHKQFDAITDISVIDASTGIALAYSRNALNKNSPSSWNSYTTYEKAGRHMWSGTTTCRTLLTRHTIRGLFAIRSTAHWRFIKITTSSTGTFLRAMMCRLTTWKLWYACRRR